MKFMTSVRAAIAATALALIPAASFATTVSSTQLTGANLDSITPFANPAFTTADPGVVENVNTSIGGTRLSPWTGSTVNSGGLFSSVPGGNTATYQFTQVQKALSFIWGSPDTYNTLTLTLGGDLVAQVIPGGTPTGPGVSGNAPLAPQSGAWLFTADNTRFDGVSFFSGANAFEIANFQTTPIPLPAAGWLLLTALGGVGLMSRRRKQSAA